MHRYVSLKFFVTTFRYYILKGLNSCTHEGTTVSPSRT